MMCGIFCVLNFIALLLGWIALVTVLLRTALGRKRYEKLTQKMFAHWFSTYWADSISKSFWNAKKELFANLKREKSADPELLKKDALNILEVGVGSGTNLEFYPPGSRLLCVDPNGEFEAFFRRECERKAAHLEPDIRFVVERGESMPSVADGSMDVVVITLVLCGVEAAQEVLQEVRRVLRPGGKFYFLEHVKHPAGSWRLLLQQVLTDSGLWPSLFDGCHLDKDLEPMMMKAGFSSVDLHRSEKTDRTANPIVASLLALITPLLYGVATN